MYCPDYFPDSKYRIFNVYLYKMNLHKHLLGWFKILGTFVFLSMFFIFISIIFSNQWYTSDFFSFYTGANLWATDPLHMYDLSLQYRYELDLNNTGNIYFYPYIYLPIFLVPIRFLLFLPPQYLYICTVIFQLILFAFCIYMLFRTFRIPFTNNLFLISFLVSFAPVFVALYNSQTSVFLFAVYTALLVSIWKRNFFWVGFIASFLLYKPQYFILPFLILMILQNINVRKGLLVGLLTHLCLNVVLLGGNIGQFVTSNIWYMTEFESKIEQTNFMVSLQSLVSMALFFLTRPILYSISIFLGSAILVGLVMYMKRRSVFFKNPIVGVVLLILGSLISGLHVHTHDAILLIIPLLYIYTAQIRPLMKFFLLTGIYLSFFLTTPFVPYKLYIFQPICIIVLLTYLMHINSSALRK
jgi:hypothetical protein